MPLTEIFGCWRKHDFVVVVEAGVRSITASVRVEADW